MSANKTLWGIPIIESDAMPRGEVILGPLPTYEDVQKYGSLENAIEAMKRQYAKIVLDDGILAADEIR